MKSAAKRILCNVRVLIVSVWILIIIILAMFFHFLYPLFPPIRYLSGGYSVGHGDLILNFHLYPLDEKIRTSSVIVLVRYEKDPQSEHEVYLAVVEDILRQNPAAEFAYSIGSYIPELNYSAYHHKGPSTYRGDKGIAFFTGIEPKLRYVASVYDNKIPDFGNMDFDFFKKLTEIE